MWQLEWGSLCIIGTYGHQRHSIASPAIWRLPIEVCLHCMWHSNTFQVYMACTNIWCCLGECFVKSTCSMWHTLRLMYLWAWYHTPRCWWPSTTYLGCLHNTGEIWIEEARLYRLLCQLLLLTLQLAMGFWHAQVGIRQGGSTTTTKGGLKVVSQSTHNSLIFRLGRPVYCVDKCAYEGHYP